MAFRRFFIAKRSKIKKQLPFWVLFIADLIAFVFTIRFHETSMFFLSRSLLLFIGMLLSCVLIDKIQGALNPAILDIEMVEQEEGEDETGEYRVLILYERYLFAELYLDDDDIVVSGISVGQLKPTLTAEDYESQSDLFENNTYGEEYPENEDDLPNSIPKPNMDLRDSSEYCFVSYKGKYYKLPLMTAEYLAKYFSDLRFTGIGFRGGFFLSKILAVFR